MNDPRKVYVVQCVLSVLSIPRARFRSNVTSTAALDSFLENPAEEFLQSFEVESASAYYRQVTFCLGHHSANGPSDVHFAKISRSSVTEDNMIDILTLSSLKLTPSAPGSVVACVAAKQAHDSRKMYLVTCVLSIFNIPFASFQSDNASIETLGRFLDDENVRYLQVVEEPAGDNGKRCAHFTLGGCTPMCRI